MRELAAAELNFVVGGQDGPGEGYDGGSTPAGYTDVDGTGRFMSDSRGEMHINPGYAGYLNSNSSRIDWGGVTLDMMTISGGAYGGIAVGAVRTAIGGGIVAFAELMKKMKEALDYEQEATED